jgi:hypothetical protein
VARLEGEFPCQAARVLRGAHDIRLHLNLGAAMRQLPSRFGKHPLISAEPGSPDRQDEQPEHVEEPARPPDHVDAPASAPVAGELLAASAGRVRLCVLCGGPLRAGQHLIRVHGSTIHACCSTTKRGSR